MTEGSGTRSGLLWEIKRLFTEIQSANGELPQILLMENVPAVIGTKNKPDFDLWCAYLESLGYSNFYQVLNATSFKIPQNRKRCFMVSVLGNYTFTFPKGYDLPIRLKDVLELSVPENFYLKDSTVESFIAYTERNNEKGNGFAFKPTGGGRGKLKQYSQEPDKELVITLSASNYGKTIDKPIEKALTICARDYKGFGSQSMTAIAEKL